MKQPRRQSKKKNSTLPLFVWFTVIAIVTIVLLEYIDFNKSGKSFLFTKVIPLHNTAKKVVDFNEKLITLLKKNKIPFDYFRDNDKKYHFKLDIDYARYDGLIEGLKRIATRLNGTMELAELQGLAEKSIMLYHIAFEKQVTHLLLISRHKTQTQKPAISPKEKEKPPAAVTYPDDKTETTRQTPGFVYDGTPRIAIIIDDVGAYEIGPLELKRLGIPITASILPDSRRATEVIHWAQEYHIETIIHLPMQPTNHKGMRLDRSKMITLESTDKEIRSIIRRFKKIVPMARGLNNHQGSLVTATPSLMKRILPIVKQEGLFFVDSRTIGRSVAFDYAKQMHIPTTHKDLFLDHIQDYSHSIAQMRKLVELARQKGKAVAIGHPFPSTIRAIRDSLDYARSKGVKFVLVKELLE